MLTKSRIQTTLTDNGVRLIQDRKTLVTVNFATLNVAEKNAKKYSALLGQPVTVIPHIHNGETLWYKLSVKEYIG